jgi:hypothetical protein
MAQTFEGQVEITGVANRVQINLDATNGGLTQLFHPNGGNPHIELVANEIAPQNTGGGLVNVTNGAGVPTIRLNGHAETIEAPVHQSTGGLAVLSGANGGLVQLFHPNGGNPHVALIGNETDPTMNTGGGLINVTNGGGNTTIQLLGHNAATGGGVVTVGDGAGNAAVALAAQVGGGGAIQLNNVNNRITMQLLQNPANGGSIFLSTANQIDTVGIGQDGANAGAIELSGPNGNQTVLIGSVMGAPNFGAIMLSGPNGQETLRLSLDTQNAGAIRAFGPNGHPIAAISSAVDSQNHTFPNTGAITLFGPNGKAIVTLSSAMGLPNNGAVEVTDATGAHQARMSFTNTGNSIVMADVKSFVVRHPAQPDTDIMYVCIEGPEAAVFVRGTAQLVNGEAGVDLPDHFVHVANLDTMTVHVTPLSADSEGLAVVGKGRAGFVVRELQRGSGNYDFDWEVKCVRRGHEDFRVIRPHSEMASLGGLPAVGTSPPLPRAPRVGAE